MLRRTRRREVRSSAEAAFRCVCAKGQARPTPIIKQSTDLQTSPKRTHTFYHSSILMHAEECQETADPERPAISAAQRRRLALQFESVLYAQAGDDDDLQVRAVPGLRSIAWAFGRPLRGGRVEGGGVCNEVVRVEGCPFPPSFLPSASQESRAESFPSFCFGTFELPWSDDSIHQPPFPT